MAALSARDYDSSELNNLVAHDLIIELEKSFDVNRLRMDGHLVWPLIRDQIIVNFSRPVLRPGARPGSEAEPRRGRREGAPAGDQIRRRETAWERLREALGPVHTDALFFSRSGGRDSVVAGKRYNLALDPMISLVRDKCSWQKVEFVKSADGASPPAWFEAVKVNPRDFVRAEMALLGDLRVENLDDLEAALPTIDGRRRPLVQKYQDFCRRLMAFHALFCRLLQQLRPHVVFHVGHSIEDLALNKACREMGVTSVDLQHGAAALIEENIKWLGWKNAPPEGYDLVADFFWVWGTAAARSINRSLPRECRRHRALVGGYLWLSEWLGAGAACRWQVSEACRALSKSAAKTVLVTLAYLETMPPPGHLFEAMRDGPKDWLWLLRMHPMDYRLRDGQQQLRDLLATHGIANVELERASGEPLPALLQIADHHVSLFSSAALEAEAFGVSSVMIHPMAADHFRRFIDAGNFKLALDSDSLLAAIRDGGDATTPSKSIETSRATAELALAEIMSYQKSLSERP